MSDKTTKPCPFCGTEDQYWDDMTIDGHEFFFLACQECGADGPTGASIDLAAAAWNTRHE